MRISGTHLYIYLHLNVYQDVNPCRNSYTALRMLTPSVVWALCIYKTNEWVENINLRKKQKDTVWKTRSQRKARTAGTSGEKEKEIEKKSLFCQNRFKYFSFKLKKKVSLRCLENRLFRKTEKHIQSFLLIIVFPWVFSHPPQLMSRCWHNRPCVPISPIFNKW